MFFMATVEFNYFIFPKHNLNFLKELNLFKISSGKPKLAAGVLLSDSTTKEALCKYFLALHCILEISSLFLLGILG